MFFRFAFAPAAVEAGSRCRRCHWVQLWLAWAAPHLHGSEVVGVAAVAGVVAGVVAVVAGLQMKAVCNAKQARRTRSTV